MKNNKFKILLMLKIYKFSWKLSEFKEFLFDDSLFILFIKIGLLVIIII